jgi:hypothetical protein
MNGLAMAILAHYNVFVPDGAPAGAAGASSTEWRQLSMDYFVDSCVTGQLREITTRPTGTRPPSPSTTTAVEVAPPAGAPAG